MTPAINAHETAARLNVAEAQVAAELADLALLGFLERCETDGGTAYRPTVWGVALGILVDRSAGGRSRSEEG